MKALTQQAVVLGVLLAGAVLGAVGMGAHQSNATAAVATDRATTEPAPAPQDRGEVAGLSGRIAEKLDVPQYTYLRLTLPAGGEAWAAVPSAAVAVGDTVTIQDPQEMRGFTSSTLKRSFDVIYFGALGATGAEPGATAYGGNPHGPGGPNPQGASPHGPGVPALRGSADPHQAPFASGDAVPVGKVTKATGPNARTVAEIHEQRTSLAGKPVRVRGTVVKSVPGVLGRTFVHLRDGSGDPTKGTHDITLTTQERPEPGQPWTFEGTLTTDKDFGNGYRYSVLVEDAQRVGE